MPPMRANSPTNNDFSVLNVPESDAPVNQLPDNIKNLAKEAGSPKGSIILNHIQDQIDIQKRVMFGEDLKKMPIEQVGQRTLASMKVISILETIVRDCEIATKAVKDAVATG